MKTRHPAYLVSSEGNLSFVVERVLIALHDAGKPVPSGLRDQVKKELATNPPYSGHPDNIDDWAQEFAHKQKET